MTQRPAQKAYSVIPQDNSHTSKGVRKTEALAIFKLLK